MLAANFWVWQQTWLIYPKLLLCLLLSLAWLGAARAIYKRAEFHLQTIGNLVEGIAGGDYSHRLRRAGPDDLFGSANQPTRRRACTASACRPKKR